MSDLRLIPSDRTGATRTVSTVVTYARSARAFCNWLLRQGYVSEPLFPDDAVPPAPQGLPQPVEPEAFVHLLYVCQLKGSLGGLNAGMTARNRAILWLFRETGLLITKVCGLRVWDGDRDQGQVRIQGPGTQERWVHLRRALSPAGRPAESVTESVGGSEQGRAQALSEDLLS